jgi:hypothetical protein
MLRLQQIHPVSPTLLQEVEKKKSKHKEKNPQNKQNWNIMG